VHPILPYSLSSPSSPPQITVHQLSYSEHMCVNACSHWRAAVNTQRACWTGSPHQTLDGDARSRPAEDGLRGGVYTILRQGPCHSYTDTNVISICTSHGYIALPASKISNFKTNEKVFSTILIGSCEQQSSIRTYR
jgi:hypothetical protein